MTKISSTPTLPLKGKAKGGVSLGHSRLQFGYYLEFGAWKLVFLLYI